MRLIRSGLFAKELKHPLYAFFPPFNDLVWMIDEGFWYSLFNYYGLILGHSEIELSAGFPSQRISDVLWDGYSSSFGQYSCE